MRWMRCVGVWLGLVLAPGVASADELSDAASAADDLWKELEDLPPRASWELGVAVSYGDITYFRALTPPWMGFGLRGGWGTHFGDLHRHRVAAILAVSLEGPVPQYFTAGVEPQVAWDHIANRIQIGASVGPSLLAHSQMTLTGQDTAWAGSPMAALRIGYSQPWSRVTRRMYVVAEPKLRWVAGEPSLLGAVVIGSGQGY